MSWLITAAADRSPKALHLPRGCTELNFSACLELFSNFFLPSTFVDSVQCFPRHFSAWPCWLCSLVCAVHPPAHRLQGFVLFVCGPSPGSSVQLRLSCLGITWDSNNSGRKISCEERSNGRGLLSFNKKCIKKRHWGHLFQF